MVKRRPCASQQNRATDVRCGSKADIGARPINVCFTPKADIGTQSWNVRFVPKADSCTAANHVIVVGASGLIIHFGLE